MSMSPWLRKFLYFYLVTCFSVSVVFVAFFGYWLLVEPNPITQVTQSVETVESDYAIIKRKFCTSKTIDVSLRHTLTNVDNFMVDTLPSQFISSEAGCYEDKYGVPLPKQDGNYLYKSYIVYYVNPLVQHKLLTFPSLVFTVAGGTGKVISRSTEPATTP